MADIRKFTVIVTQELEVELDASKFDDDFMAEFRGSFFQLHGLIEHAEHIGQMYARGIIDLSDRREFVEGYGPADEMGITAQLLHIDVEAS
jgi:hypothetical protein